MGSFVKRKALPESLSTLVLLVYFSIMNDIDLYRQILGIELPWFVRNVELDSDALTVKVYLDFDGSKASFNCPVCNQYANLRDRRDMRSWRHLDSCQFQTYIITRLPRVRCKQHGDLTINVPWAEANSRFTLLFVRFAIDVLKATQVQARAAKLLRISADQISYLMRKAVERGLQRRSRSEEIKHLGLDEKAFHRGHEYASILTDLDAGRVIDLVESRTLLAASTLLSTALTGEQKKQIRSVSMDLWPAFASAQSQILPKSDRVHDRFHIAGYLNEAVDKTRREENRRLSKQSDNTLSKTKFLWLRSEATLSPKQKDALNALQGLELQTAAVWAFKECFRQFFECQSEYGAATFFMRWYEAAMALGNRHLIEKADMLLKNLKGLTAYIRHRVTNAIAENINGQIQRVKSNARGFYKFENFRIAVLFYLGKLNLYA